MWNVKAKVVPTMIQAAGIIQKIPEPNAGKHIKELPQTVAMDTVHMLRNVLMQEFKTLVMGSNITCRPTINCNYIIAATLCTLET